MQLRRFAPSSRPLSPTRDGRSARRERTGRIPPGLVDASTDLAKRFVKRRGNWAFAIGCLLAFVNPMWADLSIVER
jgi:hypothetical protein